MVAKIVIIAIFTTLFDGMRIVVQRVRRASVTIDGRLHSAIGKGLLVLTGIEDADGPEDAAWLAAKTVNLRLFDDTGGVMHLSAAETGSEIMNVSQFTLHQQKRGTGHHISGPPGLRKRYRCMRSSSPSPGSFSGKCRQPGCSVQ